MTQEQVDAIIDLHSQIKAYATEYQRLFSILDEYIRGEQSFEGIRLYSRLHNSIDLSNTFISTTEVLNLYLTRLQAKIDELNAEFNTLINPPVVEEPVKTKRWFKFRL